MTAPAFSIPSTSLTRGLASGTHFPGAALLRDALGDVDAWVEQVAEDVAAGDQEPQAAAEQAAFIDHAEAVSRVGG